MVFVEYLPIRIESYVDIFQDEMKPIIGNFEDFKKDVLENPHAITFVTHDDVSEKKVRGVIGEIVKSIYKSDYRNIIHLPQKSYDIFQVNINQFRMYELPKEKMNGESFVWEYWGDDLAVIHPSSLGFGIEYTLYRFGVATTDEIAIYDGNNVQFHPLNSEKIIFLDKMFFETKISGEIEEVSADFFGKQAIIQSKYGQYVASFYD